MRILRRRLDAGQEPAPDRGWCAQPPSSRGLPPTSASPTVVAQETGLIEQRMWTLGLAADADQPHAGRGAAGVDRPGDRLRRGVPGGERGHDGSYEGHRPRRRPRRHLPGARSAAPRQPAPTRRDVHTPTGDQVTHSTNSGLGVVLGVRRPRRAWSRLPSPQQRRIPLPCAKLTNALTTTPPGGRPATAAAEPPGHQAGAGRPGGPAAGRTGGRPPGSAAWHSRSLAGGPIAPRGDVDTRPFMPLIQADV
jgi:hypothetical protein